MANAENNPKAKPKAVQTGPTLPPASKNPLASKPILEVENLTITYPAGGRTILDDLSFSVPAGQAVALVGESGSGKTSAALAIMGLLPKGLVKTSGKITLMGEEISNLSEEEFRKIRNVKIGMVMQNPMSCFDPVFTIWSHFKETMTSHRKMDGQEIRQKALSALAEAGFKEPDKILELFPFQMSGGMLQRVMLAIALVMSPPLAIADEATTDLDVASQALILRLLKQHRQNQNLSLLIITHDLSVAAAMASRIVVLENGRLAESGQAVDLFAQPSSPCTARLLSLHRSLYTERYLKVTENLAREVPK